MAIVKDNLLMQLVRGTLGKHFIIYERNGQISFQPDPNFRHLTGWLCYQL